MGNLQEFVRCKLRKLRTPSWEEAGSPGEHRQPGETRETHTKAKSSPPRSPARRDEMGCEEVGAFTGMEAQSASPGLWIPEQPPCSPEPPGASPAAEQQQNRSFWRAAPRSRSALSGAGRSRPGSDSRRLIQETWLEGDSRAALPLTLLTEPPGRGESHVRKRDMLQGALLALPAGARLILDGSGSALWKGGLTAGSGGVRRSPAPTGHFWVNDHRCGCPGP